jgi:ketosteroid isomerase-like protein
VADRADGAVLERELLEVREQAATVVSTTVPIFPPLPADAAGNPTLVLELDLFRARREGGVCHRRAPYPFAGGPIGKAAPWRSRFRLVLGNEPGQGLDRHFLTRAGRHVAEAQRSARYCAGMSEANVDAYQRVIAALERRDLDAILALFHAEAEFAPRTAAMEGGPYRGHDGIRSWWESMFSAYSDYVSDTEEVRVLGAVTVARACLRGHGKGSGVPLEQTQWHVAEWRDGLILRCRSFASEAEALEAAGLSE